MITKIMGLRRSGTNYLTDLVRNNYKTKVLSQESLEWWKHGSLSVNKNTADLILVMVRHPLSWLPSIFRLYTKSYRRTCETGKTFDQFVCCPYPNAYSCFINRWVFSVGYWLHKELKYDHIKIMKFEDLLYEPEEYLERELKEVKRKGDFYIPNDYCAPRSKQSPEKTRQGILEYHKTQKYMNYWDMKLISVADNQIDNELLRILYKEHHIIRPYEPWKQE